MLYLGLAAGLLFLHTFVHIFLLQVVHHLVARASRHIIDVLHVPLRVLEESIDVLTEDLLKVAVLGLSLLLVLLAD